MCRKTVCSCERFFYVAFIVIQLKTECEILLYEKSVQLGIVVK